MKKYAIFAASFSTLSHMNYQPISPRGMFAVEVARKLVPHSQGLLHYEYSYTVSCRPSGNDFLNLFAELVCKYGKLTAKSYAPMLGVTQHQLVVCLRALSHTGIREWTDAFVQAVAEALLRETDFPVGRVAEATYFPSISSFSRFFRAKYKCSPGEWRGEQLRIKN
jgi:AraC-like DNA-binding protein